MSLSEKTCSLLLTGSACAVCILILALWGISSATAAQNEKEAPPAKMINSPQKEFAGLIKQRQEIMAKEAELKLLEKQLDERLKDLEKLLATIRKESELINRVGDVRVKRLIKLYSSMDSKSAARLMEDIETSQAVEVLAGMKGEVSGPILANMESRKASSLIKLLAAYKGPSSTGR